ncbi:hypothetical protein MJL48_33195, partial [Salmonella enterica subsp. enterica serovar Kentucky]|nr:hypothetical protein [Salmonella enterica subsp. enterica serovar Kentucky]
MTIVCTTNSAQGWFSGNAVLGIIFLIAKFFTAFTDMGTGIMLDSRRKIGPKGKFRPFVLYAA